MDSRDEERSPGYKDGADKGHGMRIRDSKGGRDERVVEGARGEAEMSPTQL